MLFPPDFNLSINVSYKRLEIMLFRYCLNVILDVILEKHFGNSFRKKLNVDVFQFYFRCYPKDGCLFFVFPYTFHFQDWNNIFFLNFIKSKELHSFLFVVFIRLFHLLLPVWIMLQNVTYQASTIVIFMNKN